jgi:SAM-dependent methyltransferase
MLRSATSRRISTILRRLRAEHPRFGSLRRLYPANPSFGLGTGTPIDRHYIDQFLGERRHAIRGRVLEIGDREYTLRFGVGVEKSDVLHVVPGSPGATIIADIAHCPDIDDQSFDCIILTQTLNYLRDMGAGVEELHRILAPGGHLLCTVPGISQISRYDMERWGDRWRLTSLSASELFAAHFEAGKTEILTYGNVLSSVCFLEGLTSERLRPQELDYRDDDYQLIVAIDAVR